MLKVKVMYLNYLNQNLNLLEFFFSPFYFTTNMPTTKISPCWGHLVGSTYKATLHTLLKFGGSLALKIFC